MKLLVKEKKRKTIPPGFYQGVCVGVWDLGTHYNDTFKKSSRNVLLTWELPELTIETDDGDLPMLISKRYNQSLSKKATLRKHLQAWLGRELNRDECENGLNLETLLGRNSYLQVINEEGKDGNI